MEIKTNKTLTYSPLTVSGEEKSYVKLTPTQVEKQKYSFSLFLLYNLILILARILILMVRSKNYTGKINWGGRSNRRGRFELTS